MLIKQKRFTMHLRSTQLWIFISLFLLLLSACVSRNNQIPTKTIDQLEKKLREYGNAQVIQRGEYIRIILFKDKYFEANTNKIKPKRFPEITLIAQVLNHTTNRTILVTGHTDGVKSEKERLWESDIMARNVGSFLWAKGVPYHRMRIFGLSDKKPIATDNTPIGSAYNRRVEILVPFDPIDASF